MKIRVIGAHANRNFFDIEVEAKDCLSAFGAAALLLKEADEDHEAEFYAAIPSGTAYEMPGESVVTLGTVIEQPEVFGQPVVDQPEVDQADDLGEMPRKPPVEVAEPDRFNYMLLSRLQMDCEYYLNHGNRVAKHLWAGTEAEQIAKMKELYAALPEKPEWITLEKIEEYNAAMTAAGSMATVFCIVLKSDGGYGVDWYDTDAAREQVKGTRGAVSEHYFELEVRRGLTDDEITLLVDEAAERRQ